MIYHLCLCVLVCSSFGGSDVGTENKTTPNITLEGNNDHVTLITENDISVTTLENSDIPTGEAGGLNSSVSTEPAAEVTVENGTDATLLENGTDAGVNKTKTKVTCQGRNLTEGEIPSVKLVNSTVLLSVVVPEPNITANECVLVMFYAPWCHFSAMAAPHYNALARVYPSVHLLAINAIKYYSLNSRYGTVAVPTLLLFHNGRAVAKFNDSQYVLDKYVKFVEKYTGLHSEGLVNVTSADFAGPLPSEPTQETDYVLWLAWLFIVSCCTCGFAKSSLCHRMVETVRNNWREAEAQHEHAD